MEVLLVLGWLITAVVMGVMLKLQSSEISRMEKMLGDWQQTFAARNAEAKKRAEDYYAQKIAEVQKREYEAKEMVRQAEIKAGNLINDTEEVRRNTLQTALSTSERMIKDAKESANAIAGEALQAKRDAEVYEQAAKAMQNLIKGYGDEYLLPTSNLLDELGEEFSHEKAGLALKAARLRSREIVKEGRASFCDYVETERRQAAEAFVLDAFNGKVDSILSRLKGDNHGKLAQEIKDAAAMVNLGGKAFRDARVTQEYLSARLEEVRWGCVVAELKRQNQEQQRKLREQARDEEKARRDYERALRETEREEEALRKAMAKAQAAIDAATGEQRAKFEAQLAEMAGKLKEAEEKNQRALSMAQQTKRGFVYIISNVGSFGENVYKIGLTRRLDPQDRIDELGDASVPFDFDVHALILSEDAPALEHQLHKHFILNQVNKVNHRKEFFRTQISKIKEELDGLGITASWTMASEAAEYRETLAIERLISEDPKARERWMSRQLVMEAQEVAETA